jgi:hypothetical protein
MDLPRSIPITLSSIADPPPLRDDPRLFQSFHHLLPRGRTIPSPLAEDFPDLPHG